MAAFAVLAALAVALFAAFQTAGSQASTLELSLRWTPEGASAAVTESDNVVEAGTSFQIFANIVDDNDATTTLTVDYTVATDYLVSDSGVIVRSVTANVTGIGEGSANASQIGNLIVPPDTAGTFAIRAQAGTRTGSLDVTVGDVGTAVASVEVVLGKVGHVATADTSPDSVPAGTADANEIPVTVKVYNSLGNPSNQHEVAQVILFAPAAFAGQGTDSATANSASYADTSADTTIADASRNFSVRKATPGTVNVTALAIGSGGDSATSQVLVLSFTGTADTIALSDASSPIPPTSAPGTGDPVVGRTHITVDVTAVDASGNKASLAASAIPEASITFEDADGDAVTTLDVPAANIVQKPAPTPADAAATDPNTVQLTVEATNADAGEYTMKVVFGTKDAVTTTIYVAGAAANVALEADPESGSTFAEQITVTATVTDKDGVPVINGTAVNFVASPHTVLQPIGASHTGVETKNGVATVMYAVVGSGSAIVSASTVDTMITAITGVTNDLGDGEVADDTPSLSDFSRLSGLASYTGPDAQASELMALLAGRATAIWLSSGDGWVLYASADGAMVPGSENFTATSGDVIYISN